MRKAPMAATAEGPSLQEATGHAILPDMFFPRNGLELAHAASGVTITFTAVEAMKEVAKRDPGIRVAANEQWRRSNEQQVERMGGDLSMKDEHKNWDWTYSTEYKGTVVGAAARLEPSAERIDLARLRQPDPILYWDDTVLYEDELSDNGQAMLSIKIRVMPTCLLVLQRFFLRVDGVLLRLLETRLFLDYAQPHLVREWVHKEESVTVVQQALGEEYAVKCRDANALGELLPQRRLLVDRIVYKG